ncbi:TEK-like protein [Anabaenopsis sp. FSS-46]|uniref:TEK-like protein n=1 Tax=Anabaenopsis sp. FSS-46 TaxID=2971766 RepID=UPI002475E91D|nr:TEK-like protein [Anabaenopsis sp. FSS-46]MDH6099011.1 TEK-like protein [Anabaenopsis sp. FSS-46]
MDTNAKKLSKAAAIASLLAGGAVAGSFIAAQPAQAQTANSASVAVTNILSNGNTVTFAGEVVMPLADTIVDGTVTLQLGYVTANGAPDNVLLGSATLNVGDTPTTTVQSVAAATARAIDAAKALTRFGDIIGIVEAASLD